MGTPTAHFLLLKFCHNLGRFSFQWLGESSFDILYDLLPGLLIPAADHDLRALLATDLCHGPSDTLGASGDHDHFVF